MNKYEAMDVYQTDVLTFDFHPEKLRRLLLAAGLSAEAGEVQGKIYKLVRDDHNVNDVLLPEQRHAVAKELGDVLWFVAALADELGYSLSDIAEINIDKLEDRMLRGALEGEGDNR